MLMCCNFVINLGASVTISQTVCALSHSIEGCSYVLRLIWLKTRNHQYSWVVTCDRASSSALVVDLTTVLCFELCQSIRELNRWNVYPSVLCRVSVSSANDASNAAWNSPSSNMLISFVQSTFCLR
jgi:hypothetical protein